MQVILMEKMVNLGQLGDVVKVKNGYARNFLIPQGKAKRATEGNKAEFAVRRLELEAAEQAKVGEAQARAEKYNGLTVQIVQKAGVDGKLFGSVTNADIVTALALQGFTVEKTQVRMSAGHIKQVGDYPVNIALHTDVIANIIVSVLGEHKP
ncbi:50S ribosomal protein L9 [Candidatus Nitrotoga arctica]|uniref:Large ribosomal subunit protein bL9 n=1 Tax=Candidatus Nitrotoga arctica TaxID=453162 RepID=A0ABM8YZR4_9PROT|nr:50S ribosomal protein L9 [Candidatus Nitrotoga arctica]CAG9933035.1 50S ribosomal subunit protein L9 [Candidatus Nitrotoga arctica]